MSQKRFVIGVAVIRFRQWDRDPLIRRTLVDGALTGALALVYFGVVTILPNLVFPTGASRPPAIVVISTLAVAGLSTLCACISRRRSTVAFTGVSTMLPKPWRLLRRLPGMKWIWTG